MARKWNTTRFGVFGFLLGAIPMEFVMFRHPDALPSSMPTVSVIFAGLTGLLVFAGAAVSLNRFVHPAPREAQKAQAKNWSAARLGALGFLLGAAAIESAIFLHPHAALSHMPIIAAIFGGFLGLMVFGGAAVGHNRFGQLTAKWTG